jgi:beta-lactamase class A
MTFSLTESGSYVAFIDQGLADGHLLAAALSPGTQIHFLDPAADALAQINQVLAHQQDLDGLAIFSHGSAGSLQLGELRLDSQALAANSAAIAAWSTALAPGADLLLYGCNVAANEVGRAFLQDLHALTGADVAGSDDLTGIAVRNGNWNLEVQTGAIESADLLDDKVASTYDHLLSTGDRSNVLGDWLLNSVRGVGFDQVNDFGPIEDFFSPSPAPRIAYTPNVDVAVIELDRDGELKSVADVLLSRDYPGGLKVPVNDNHGTDAVRWLKWDIDRWNGGTFGVQQGKLRQFTTKGWTTNPDLTAKDDIVLRSGNEPYTFMSPYPASLFKVLVGYHIMTMVDDGDLSLDQTYTYKATDKNETRTIRDWMDPMITYSDNRSTRALLKLLHDRKEVDDMNAEFQRLGLGTLQINGTSPGTGGTWQPGEIHMTALDTARLLWLIDGAPNDYVLWENPQGAPVTPAELSDSSRAYLKDLLAQQGYNEALTTSNFGTYESRGVIYGAPNTRPGIPSLVPSRWIDPEDGTVTVDGISYGQDVRFYNDKVAEVSFAHKTGLTYNYGSDAGIVESLPGKPYRHYIIAYLSNLGYRYIDDVFADRQSYPYLDPVGGIAYTQRIPTLGKMIDDGLRNSNLA